MLDNLKHHLWKQKEQDRWSIKALHQNRGRAGGKEFLKNAFISWTNLFSVSLHFVAVRGFLLMYFILLWFMLSNWIATHDVHYVDLCSLVCVGDEMGFYKPFGVISSHSVAVFLSLLYYPHEYIKLFNPKPEREMNIAEYSPPVHFHYTRAKGCCFFLKTFASSGKAHLHPWTLIDPSNRLQISILRIKSFARIDYVQSQCKDVSRKNSFLFPGWLEWCK